MADTPALTAKQIEAVTEATNLTVKHIKLQTLGTDDKISTIRELITAARAFLNKFPRFSYTQPVTTIHALLAESYLDLGNVLAGGHNFSEFTEYFAATLHHAKEADELFDYKRLPDEGASILAATQKYYLYRRQNYFLALNQSPLIGDVVSHCQAQALPAFQTYQRNLEVYIEQQTTRIKMLLFIASTAAYTKDLKTAKKYLPQFHTRFKNFLSFLDDYISNAEAYGITPPVCEFLTTRRDKLIFLFNSSLFPIQKLVYQALKENKPDLINNYIEKLEEVIACVSNDSPESFAHQQRIWLVLCEHALKHGQIDLAINFMDKATVLNAPEALAPNPLITYWQENFPDARDTNSLRDAMFETFKAIIESEEEHVTDNAKAFYSFLITFGAITSDTKIQFMLTCFNILRLPNTTHPDPHAEAALIHAQYLFKRVSKESEIVSFFCGVISGILTQLQPYYHGLIEPLPEPASPIPTPSTSEPPPPASLPEPVVGEITLPVQLSAFQIAINKAEAHRKALYGNMSLSKSDKLGYLDIIIEKYSEANLAAVSSKEKITALINLAESYYELGKLSLKKQYQLHTAQTNFEAARNYILETDTHATIPEDAKPAILHLKIIIEHELAELKIRINDFKKFMAEKKRVLKIKKLWHRNRTPKPETLCIRALDDLDEIEIDEELLTEFNPDENPMDENELLRAWRASIVSDATAPATQTAYCPTPAEAYGDSGAALRASP